VESSRGDGDTRKSNDPYVFSESVDASIARSDLFDKVDVCNGILDVALEVADLAAAPRPLQVEVDPSDEDLLWGELHELLEGFALVEQSGKTRMLVQVDVRKQTDLK
jgi:hypothetical protein